jgi:hypothetical protein
MSVIIDAKRIDVHHEKTTLFHLLAIDVTSFAMSPGARISSFESRSACGVGRFILLRFDQRWASRSRQV